MNKLRWVMRKSVHPIDGNIQYYRVLQELVSFGGPTSEWRDVPCEMEDGEPPETK